MSEPLTDSEVGVIRTETWVNQSTVDDLLATIDALTEERDHYREVVKLSRHYREIVKEVLSRGSGGVGLALATEHGTSARELDAVLAALPDTKETP
jgi:hypothetical protein